MTVQYWLLNSNIDTTCDPLGSNNYDLVGLTGTGDSSHTYNVAGITTTTFIGAYDVDVGGDNPTTGSHTLNLIISNVRNALFKFRLKQINDSGCGATNTSAFSTEYGSAGTITDSISLTWTGGSGDRLRLEVWGYETVACGTRAFVMDVGTNSYFDAPFDVDIYQRALTGVGL
jgi:hypothetical protein